MSNDQPIEPNEIDELTSYLDREVNEEVGQSWDRRLAEDPDLRRQAASLQRAWDALDLLPRDRASDGFTRTTAELAKKELVDSQGVPLDERLRTTQASPRFSQGIFGRPILWSVGLASAFGLAYAVVRLAPNPTDHIRDHLDVLENLPAYEAIGDAEFMKLLADKEKETEFRRRLDAE